MGYFLEFAKMASIPVVSAVRNYAPPKDIKDLWIGYIGTNTTDIPLKRADLIINFGAESLNNTAASVRTIHLDSNDGHMVYIKTDVGIIGDMKTAAEMMLKTRNNYTMGRGYDEWKTWKKEIIPSKPIALCEAVRRESTSLSAFPQPSPDVGLRAFALT